MAGEVHRYKVGDIDVTVLSDGFRMVPVNANYLSNASADDLAKALSAAGQPTDKMMVQGFHYPFPAVAYVEKAGSGYREIPVMWNSSL